jgi:hypothetical protein
LCRNTGNPRLRDRVSLVKRTGNLRETLNHIGLSSHAAGRLGTRYAFRNSRQLTLSAGRRCPRNKFRRNQPSASHRICA